MRELVIGGLRLPGAVAMAPLAGIGNKAFRLVARRHGAALVVTPLLSAEAMVRDHGPTLDMATPHDQEHPCAVQLFGADPRAMAAAAKRAQSLGADLIDINAGCPSARITALGAGAALLRDLDRLEAIASAVVDAVSVPVTVKTRVGWSPPHVSVVDALERLQRAGVSAVVVHARFRRDGPSTPARWEWVRAAVEAATIPVIGNGGITRPQDAAALVATTGCAGVMVGRAAVGRPWLLAQCQQALDGRPPQPDPPLEARLEMALAHLALARQLDASSTRVAEARAALLAYLRQTPGAKRARQVLQTAKTYPQLEACFREILAGLLPTAPR